MNIMIKNTSPTGLLIIILTTPALLNAAPIIEGEADLLTSFFSHSPGGPLSGRVEMDGVRGIDTPANDGVFLFSFNGFGETILNFETGDLISLDGGVYTWNGGGFITQSGALGPPSTMGAGDFIVPDITFLAGEWMGPITGQIEDSGDFVVRGSGTDVKDQTLLDFYGIPAADNSWQYSFELSLAPEEIVFQPDGSFDLFADISRPNLFFNNTNTATSVPAPTTLILFMIGLVTLGFYNFRRKRSNLHNPFDSSVAWVQ
ncbi:PEP-CTERM putative exosortase interaction domain protein [Nitrosococcus oceani AFC27]|nr:PEP-CTERM putative exosortase interaction domain protein [Nitrosococcus oceani AFC27]KFI18965.1 glycosyl transferase family 1 [Nitrosococcus oceani C-27]